MSRSTINYKEFCSPAAWPDWPWVDGRLYQHRQDPYRSICLRNLTFKHAQKHTPKKCENIIERLTEIRIQAKIKTNSNFTKILTLYGISSISRNPKAERSKKESYPRLPKHGILHLRIRDVSKRIANASRYHASILEPHAIRSCINLRSSELSSVLDSS